MSYSFVHEIDADSIAVVESDVPVLPGTKGLICLDRYINDTTTTDTERVLYVDGKEVELIDPETGIEYLFKNAAVDGLGNLYILGHSYIEFELSLTHFCMWKNGEIWWKETVSNYGNFSNNQLKIKQLYLDIPNIFLNFIQATKIRKWKRTSKSI